jgi:hypothetical protein
MSVLIKGMKMPDHCWECWLMRNMVCGASGELIPLSGRRKHCPLVDLGKHGRLIDADAMMDDICNSINQMTKIGIAIDGNYLWGKLDDALNNALTIVEAEDARYAGH